VYVERKINSVDVQLIPSQTSAAASEIILEYEELFLKGNLVVTFGDGDSYSTRLYFAESSPRITTVSHR